MNARVAESARRRCVEIKPRDAFRYGYMLWLDQETAMPLKSQLDRRARGRIVEQILFTEIKLRRTRSPSRGARDNDRHDGIHDAAARRSSSQFAGPGISWRAATVPGGFKLSIATQSPIAGSEYPVEHLVYSDGLATVSVFIEDPKTQADVG